MPYNGSGVFTRLYDWTDERDAANNIDSVKMDAEDDGFATGLSNAITKDGQTTVTANLPMASYKHTNVGAASARTDYARADQIQDSGFQLIGSISGTDTITGSLTPSISAYAAGQTFKFVSAGANTGAVTLNVNGAGAKAVTKAGTNALVAGDIPSGAIIHVVYDGTRFQMVPVPNISAAAAAVLDDATASDMQTSLGATATGKSVFTAANAAAGMAAVTPTTTRGDLIRRGASADERFALGSDGQVVASDGTDALWEWKGVVNLVSEQDGTGDSTTNTISASDTTPTTSNGKEWGTTAAITPKATSHRLLIDVSLYFSSSGAGVQSTIALFKDSDTDALATASSITGGANNIHPIRLLHEMEAGTTSEITFKIRYGGTSGTMYLNTQGGSASFNGTLASRITITEVAL